MCLKRREISFSSSSIRIIFLHEWWCEPNISPISTYKVTLIDSRNIQVHVFLVIYCCWRCWRCTCSCLSFSRDGCNIFVPHSHPDGLSYLWECSLCIFPSCSWQSNFSHHLSPFVFVMDILSLLYLLSLNIFFIPKPVSEDQQHQPKQTKTIHMKEISFGLSIIPIITRSLCDVHLYTEKMSKSMLKWRCQSCKLCNHHHHPHKVFHSSTHHARHAHDTTVSHNRLSMTWRTFSLSQPCSCVQNIMRHIINMWTNWLCDQESIYHFHCLLGVTHTFITCNHCHISWKWL